jgi:hypothetical protein
LQKADAHSGCHHSRDLEAVAKRHRDVLNRDLGFPGSSEPDGYNQAQLQAFGEVLQGSMLSQIPVQAPGSGNKSTKFEGSYPFRGRDGSERPLAELNPCLQLDSRLHLRQRPPVMGTPPVGIPQAVWLSCPPDVRELILALQREIQAHRQENEQLRGQLTALATELAQRRERIGRGSRNSSSPPGFREAVAALQ